MQPMSVSSGLASEFEPSGAQPLTEAQRDQIKQVLDTERAAAAARIGSSEEDGSSRSDDSSEAPSQFEIERERLMAKRADEHIVALVEASARLDDGSYGICQKCGVGIPFERLEALPLTLACVNCA